MLYRWEYPYVAPAKKIIDAKLSRVRMVMRLLEKTMKCSKGMLRIIIVVSVFLGATFSLGYFLEAEGRIRFDNLWLYMLWLGASAVLVFFLFALFCVLDRYKRTDAEKISNMDKALLNWKWMYGILVVCYTITFLGVFPGFYAYDATMAHWQYYYNNITSQHPWIHTWILGYITEFSKSHLGHPNTGIAIYIYVQMLFIAGCFTYTLVTVKKHMNSRIAVVVSLIFYALFPTIHMFVLCSTKDTIFTALMLVFCVSLYEMFLDKEDYFRRKGKVGVFIFSAVGVLILRKNAFYAFLVFTPIFLFFIRKYIKRAALLIGSIWLLYWIYSIPLTNAMGIIDIGPQEALSVPSQQIARVYNWNREVMTEEEVELVERFYQKELIEMYLPKLADYTKGGLKRDYFEAHLQEYIQLWLSLGCKAPNEYIDSFLVNNYGFWYPFASLDGYKGYVGMEGTVLEDAEVYYFAYVTEEPGKRISLIPALDKLYYFLSTVNMHKKLPVVSLLFSPGFMFWIMVIAFAYSIYDKRFEFIPMFLLMLLMWLTVLLGPIALVRYVLFLFFCFPLVLSALFKRSKVLNEEV